LLEATKLALPIAHDQPVIVYGEHGADERVRAVAEKFRAEGYEDVRVLEATLGEVERAGGSTQEPSTEQVVPPHRSEEVQPLDRRL
jgi:3-mercaptopyruvate sulfurtransferase SseA